MKTDFQPSDFHSATWGRIAKHANERLAEVRAKLELGTQNDDKLRGRILELKELLGLAEPEPNVESTPPGL